MSNEELRKMLSQDMYAYETIIKGPLPNRTMVKNLGELVINIFDELKNELGRLATRDEYVDEYFDRVDSNIKRKNKKYKKEKRKHKIIKWKKKEKDTLREIAHFAYSSLVVEYATVIQLKNLFPESKILTSRVIDGAFGADIVMYLNDKVTYIHVTTSNSERFVNKKKTGAWKSRSDIMRIYQRNYEKGHSTLRYSNRNNRTEKINGNTIFKDSALVSFIEKVFSTEGLYESTDETTCLDEFFRWCNLKDVEYKSTLKVL